MNSIQLYISLQWFWVHFLANDDWRKTFGGKYVYWVHRLFYTSI